jgi:CRISPR-associated protein Csb2
VRFAFVDGQPTSHLTVAIAEAFRSAALSALRTDKSGCQSFRLSGHHPDGSPDQDHQHAYYLPERAKDGSLTLVGILIVTPVSRFSDEEVEALRTVTRLKWSGLKMNVALVDVEDSAAVVVSTEWTSMIPYVPPRRFWGTHGKRHLLPEKQLETELSQRLPQVEIATIDIRPWHEVRVRVAGSKHPEEVRPPAKRRGFHVSFRLRQPVCGPVALGHSSHYGLGQFRPLVN